MPIAVFEPTYKPAEELTDAELEERYRRTEVTPEFRKTDEYFTPENRLLASYLKRYSMEYPFIHAYDQAVSQIFPAQWRNVSFTHRGSRVEFLNVRYETPRANGVKIYPSFSLEHREHGYSAGFFVMTRLTDPKGANRVLELDFGLLPVMVSSSLCNLHPANIDWDLEDEAPEPTLDAFVTYQKAECQLTDEQRLNLRIDNFYRKHAQCTFRQVAVFVENQMEIVGINLDAQRTGVRQVVNYRDRMCHLRFISTEMVTSSVEVFVHETKRAVTFPTIQMHNADFMRGAVVDNYLNMFVPFAYAGWSYERVLEEALRFAPDDVGVRNSLEYELRVTWQEYEVIMGQCDGDVAGHIQSHMRDHGRNPLTGRLYTPDQVRYFFIRGLFTHYEMPGGDSKDYEEVLEDVFTRKLRMLLLMVVEMKLRHFGVLAPVERDCWSNKKLVTIVKNMQNLMAKHALEVRRQWIRALRVENILEDVEAIDPVRFVADIKRLYEITRTFQRSLTGKSWGVFMPVSQSKAQNLQCHEKLSRESLLAAISKCRRTRKPVCAQSRGVTVRSSNPTGTDTICPGDGAGGAVVGLVENLAMTTQISTYISERPIIFLLRTMGYVEEASPTSTHNVVLIVGGVFVGWCERKLEHILRGMKRSNTIDRLVAIVYTTEQVPMLNVYLDEGRLLAPMLVVNAETGRILADERFPGVTDFETLERNGCVEFIDPVERKEKIISYDRTHLQERSREMLKDRRLARQRLRDAEDVMDPDSLESLVRVKRARKTHDAVMAMSRVDYVNLDPCTLLGPSIGICPNVQHNSTVRAGFSGGQMRGAISRNVSNPASRTDVNSREPMYTGEPNFHTVMGDAIGRDVQYTSPFTCMVDMDECNQEDANVLDEAASQAGLGAFWSRRRKDYEEEENLRFGIAPGKAWYSKYKHIDPMTGLPRRGATIREEDVLIAMTLNGTHASDVHLSHGEMGVVDMVHLINKGTSGSCKRVFIILSVFHTLVEGNKVCAVESQKSVIGDLRPRVDMPQIYGKPHIRIMQILNIIPLNGRITVSTTSHLKYGRMRGIAGITPNATPFSRFNPTTLERAMINRGFRPNGMERVLLPDGRIARKRAFTGVISIAILPHYAADKIHCRGTGPRELTTEQAVPGRSRHGGLRSGAMEITQLINLGCMGQIHERIHIHGDNVTFVYCQRCKNRVDTLLYNGIRCQACQHDSFYRVRQPYVIRYLEALLSLINMELLPTLAPVFSTASSSSPKSIHARDDAEAFSSPAPKRQKITELAHGDNDPPHFAMRVVVSEDTQMLVGRNTHTL
jgi:DNA-directed RNA polymerase beta subunit